MKEGVVQEDGALSGLYLSVVLSNFKCITPAPVGPCATSVCQHPRIQVVPAVGKGDFVEDAKVLCRGVPDAGVGGQIPAVPVLSDAVGTNREKIIWEERLNTNPLGEKYSSSLSEA